MKLQLWQSTAIGGLAGFLLGFALEAGRDLWYDYTTQLMVEKFKHSGGPPVLMVDMEKFSFIPFVTCAVFAAISTSIYLIRSHGNED
jgi:hypothetical protein